MITFNHKEIKLLNALGKSTYGPQILEVFKRLKDEMSSIDGITGDYAAHVEGRKLFKKFLEELSDKISSTSRVNKNAIGDDDFE